MRRLKKNKKTKKADSASARPVTVALDERKSGTSSKPKSQSAADKPGKKKKRGLAKRAARAPKQTIRQRLYSDDAKGLFQLVCFSPLFIGAWISGGLALDEIRVFAVATGVPLLIHFLLSTYERTDIFFVKEMRMLVLAGAAGLSIFLYQITKQPLFSLLLVLAAASQLAGGLLMLQQRSARTAKNILLQCGLLVLQMSVLGIVGIHTQRFSQGEISYVHCLIGFVPGMILAGSLIARFAVVFETKGWSRSYIVSKNEEEKRRPGGISRTYSLLTVIGPAIPIAFAPLGLFPAPFLLAAFLFVPIPKLAESFFNSDKSDQLVADQTATVAALASLLMLVAGGLVRLGL